MPDKIGTGTTNTLAGQFIRVIIGGYDLTEFVMSFSTKRSITTPLGSWTVNFRPIIRNGSVCDLPIKINDYCEIRAGRTKNAQGLPPLLMRGLVDGISLREEASQSNEGTVSRAVVIGGSDLGKLFAKRSIAIQPDGATAGWQQTYSAYYKDFFKSYDSNGNKTATINNFDTPLSKWIELFFSKIYNQEYAQIMSKYNGSGSHTLKTVIDIPEGNNGQERFKVLSTPIMNTQTGSLWQFITMYCKAPFFEMFIDDEEDVTNIYARWTPYLTAEAVAPLQWSSKKPWNNKKIPEVFVGYNTVISQDFMRNDFDRYTYFFTKFDQAFLSVSAGSGTSTIADWSTSNPIQNGKYGEVQGTYVNPYADTEGQKQFGFKPMQPTIPFYGVSTNSSDDTKKIEIMDLLRDANKWLVDVFGFSDQLYHGQIVFIGNPDIHIGKWLLLGKGKSQVRIYAESVEHTVSVFPNPSFVTRVNFTRGEGFDPKNGEGRTVHPKYLKKVNFVENINTLGSVLTGR